MGKKKKHKSTFRSGPEGSAVDVVDSVLMETDSPWRQILRDRPISVGTRIAGNLLEDPSQLGHVTSFYNSLSAVFLAKNMGHMVGRMNAAMNRTIANIEKADWSNYSVELDADQTRNLWDAYAYERWRVESRLTDERSKSFQLANMLIDGWLGNEDESIKRLYDLGLSALRPREDMERIEDPAWQAEESDLVSMKQYAGLVIGEHHGVISHPDSDNIYGSRLWRKMQLAHFFVRPEQESELVHVERIATAVHRFKHAIGMEEALARNQTQSQILELQLSIVDDLKQIDKDFAGYRSEQMAINFLNSRKLELAVRAAYDSEDPVSALIALPFGDDVAEVAEDWQQYPDRAEALKDLIVSEAPSGNKELTGFTPARIEDDSEFPVPLLFPGSPDPLVQRATEMAGFGELRKVILRRMKVLEKYSVTGVGKNPRAEVFNVAAENGDRMVGYYCAKNEPGYEDKQRRFFEEHIGEVESEHQKMKASRTFKSGYLMAADSLFEDQKVMLTFVANERLVEMPTRLSEVIDKHMQPRYQEDNLEMMRDLLALESRFAEIGHPTSSPRYGRFGDKYILPEGDEFGAIEEITVQNYEVEEGFRVRLRFRADEELLPSGQTVFANVKLGALSPFIDVTSDESLSGRHKWWLKLPILMALDRSVFPTPEDMFDFDALSEGDSRRRGGIHRLGLRADKVGVEIARRPTDDARRNHREFLSSVWGEKRVREAEKDRSKHPYIKFLDDINAEYLAEQEAGKTPPERRQYKSYWRPGTLPDRHYDIMRFPSLAELKEERTKGV